MTQECASLASAESAPGPRSVSVVVFVVIDSMELKSSMSLFAVASPDDPLFQQVLDKYYGGEQDALTLRILGV